MSPHRAQVAHGLDDVAGAGLALGADHRRALADAAQRLAEVAAAADERDLERRLSMWCSSSAGVSTSLSSMKSTSSASRICASTKWPMRHFAITGIVTASWISWIIVGVGHARDAAFLADVRRHALERHHRARARLLGDCACSASTTSMMTPPLSISARPGT